ncbi:MAG: arsenate reductase ArsC [Planctomycetes bacterium]|nr:arsenate reductase ArsC [Planctomycetota bacterium]
MSADLRQAQGRPKVLFLCTGNSARSQMAEAWLRKLGGDRFEAYSAGTDPKGVNPLTIEVLREAGVDIPHATSKHFKQYFGHVVFHYLITVCAEADAACPVNFPGVRHRFKWSFDDPAAATGTREEKLAVFRRVRDEIKGKIEEFLASQASASHAKART